MNDTKGLITVKFLFGFYGDISIDDAGVNIKGNVCNV